jgi:hypothetical protein
MEDLIKVFQKHNFDPVKWKFKGQKDYEERVQYVKDNPWPEYDEATYGSHEDYAHFLKNKDLKYIWAHNSERVRYWQLDPNEVYKLCPDRCPMSGVLIDYGIGRNKITSKIEFRPSIEHIVARANGGEAYGDINNIEILTQASNMYKSKGTLLNFLQGTYYQLKKTVNGV